MTKANHQLSSWRTVRTFFKTGTCSEAIMNVLDRAFDNPLELEEHGAMPLAGGIAQQGYQCGMLWGATLAAGAQACRLHGASPEAEAAAMTATQRLVQAFRDRHNTLNCLEITDTDWKKKSDMIKNFLKGGPITCTRMSVQFAPVALNEIAQGLSTEPAKQHCSKENCAVRTAKRLGASAKHATMAAGFAGGIGLSGGACGALGAAIWLVGMHCSRAGSDYGTVNSIASEVIEKFLAASDYEFECSTIAGQKFDTMDEHDRYLRAGSCSQIIDALVDSARKQMSAASEAA